MPDAESALVSGRSLQWTSAFRKKSAIVLALHIVWPSLLFSKNGNCFNIARHYVKQLLERLPITHMQR